MLTTEFANVLGEINQEKNNEFTECSEFFKKVIFLLHSDKILGEDLIGSESQKAINIFYELTHTKDIVSLFQLKETISISKKQEMLFIKDVFRFFEIENIFCVKQNEELNSIVFVKVKQ